MSEVDYSKLSIKELDDECKKCSKKINDIIKDISDLKDEDDNSYSKVLKKITSSAGSNVRIDSNINTRIIVIHVSSKNADKINEMRKSIKEIYADISFIKELQGKKIDQCTFDYWRKELVDSLGLKENDKVYYLSDKGQMLHGIVTQKTIKTISICFDVGYTKRFPLYVNNFILDIDRSKVSNIVELNNLSSYDIMQILSK